MTSLRRPGGPTTAVRSWGMSSGGVDTKSAKLGPLARRSCRSVGVRRVVEAAEANARQVWNETAGWESTERWTQHDPIALKDIWSRDSKLCSQDVTESELWWCADSGKVPQPILMYITLCPCNRGS